MKTLTKKEQLIMTVKEVMVYKNITKGWFVKYIEGNATRLTMVQLNAILKEIGGC